MSKALPTAVSIAFLAAERLGMETEVLDPEYGYLYELRWRGARRIMVGGRSPLNDSVAAHLASDKHYSGLLLRRAGLRVAETRRCLSPAHPANGDPERSLSASIETGLELAERFGFPLVAKPNRLSHGRGVQLVHDRAQLSDALESIWRLDPLALLQERLVGRDLRLDYLDGVLLLGYERCDLRVMGDGETRLRALFCAEDQRLLDDAKWLRLLQHEQLAGDLYDADTLLEAGQELRLRSAIFNLNSGSTAVVYRPDEELNTVALAAGRALGLRHFGVDLKLGPEGPAIIEVNASPLLSQMYLMGHQEAVLAAQELVLRAAFEGRVHA